MYPCPQSFVPPNINIKSTISVDGVPACSIDKTPLPGWLLSAKSNLCVKAWDLLPINVFIGVTGAPDQPLLYIVQFSSFAKTDGYQFSSVSESPIIHIFLPLHSPALPFLESKFFVIT